MIDDIAAQAAMVPDVTVSGGGYRATTTGGGAAWFCPHVHFTAQSARSCADARVKTVGRRAARLDPEGSSKP